MKSGVKDPNYFLTEKRLVESDDTGVRYCVPRDISQDIIVAYHSQGHPSLSKLLSLIQRRFTFSLKAKDLHQRCWEICQHCQVCQAVKPRKGQVPGTMDFCPIPQEIFSSLCMDFVDIEPCKGTDGIYIYI